jgi:hypothetical protein
MIQSTCQPESTLFPVFGLVVAVSLNLSDLRLLGIGQTLPNLGACDNRWAVHQIRRGAPGTGILAISEGDRPQPPNHFATQTMRKIESLMNSAITNRQDWSSANTRVEYEQGNCISRVYLHGNKIAEVGDTWMQLFDGGWQSNTTKSRLNALLSAHGIGGEGVFQKNFDWFFRMSDGSVVPFFSGMRLN